jgi:hypothetical protein
MRYLLVGLVWMTLAAATPAAAQLSLGFSGGGVSIGINVPTYPRLVRVPGYPVYYAPTLGANYFFYDGLYWVFQDDNWYASDWYNGPWRLVAPDEVPLYVLRVPVRYYHRPPAYFHGWAVNAAPRWDEHWGHNWSEHHRGWDHWDHAHAPRAAPLPSYQRHYAGNRYPRAEEQHAVREHNYNYQPRDNAARQHYEQQRTQHAQRQEEQRQGRENLRPDATRSGRPAGEIRQDKVRGGGNQGQEYDRGDHPGTIMPGKSYSGG